MHWASRFMFVFLCSLVTIANIHAQQAVQIAGLQANPELRWQRTSPTPPQPDGPVLYQLLFTASGTPGTVPAFDTNPRHLTNSPITVNGSNVVIGGGSGLTINGGSGVMTFANGQTFPASGLPNLGGEVTGPPGTTVVSNAVSTNTANAIVRRDGSGNFLAGTVTLNGNLALPNTTSATVGVLTLGGTPFLHNFGTFSTFLGASAGNFTMSGGYNSGFGSGALSSNTSGSFNSAFGSGTMIFNTIGSSNTAFGYNTLFMNTSANFNTAFGTAAMFYTTTGSNNDAFGNRALLLNTTGASNSAFGDNALTSNTTASNNSAFGNVALGANTSGVNNAAFGAAALSGSTTGSNNSAFGTNSLRLKTSGDGNTAVGFLALGTLATGSFNTAIGLGAGNALTGVESYNIYIGNNGVAGESRVIRIGDNSQGEAFIAGISGATVATGVPVLVDSSGRLGTTTSSRRYKQDIADLGGESDILMKLRPVAFYYKPELDSTHTRQYGLVAEEVAQIAPGLVVFDQDGKPQTVRYHFVNAMLLNEVQKQRRMIEAQQSENEAQKQQIQAMQEQMEALREQNSLMQQQMKAVMLRLAAVEKSAQSSTVEALALNK
ncbi:MAG TPA: tail fiber domain-containing protein [Candidatus Angelobacter sp.]|nr:tail fiber domain-containing protein [Candidatus Angelobacter sp.]